MSGMRGSKANPVMVGAFVLGAVALAAGGLAAFGGGAWFTNHPRAVSYFAGSIDGLSVGAPVTWRGAHIGRVTEIRLDVDAIDHVFRIPVYMEFDTNAVNFLRGSAKDLTAGELVKQGLRAQLKSQSLITGALYVELELRPDMPAKLVGADKSVPEIPTIPSTLETLEAQVTGLPLRQLGDTANQMLTNLNALASSPQLKDLLASLARTNESMNGLIEDLHGEVGPMADSLISSADALKATLGEFQKTARDSDAELASTAGDLRAALKGADQSFRQAQSTLASVNSLVSPNSTERETLDQILRDLSYSSQSLRRFSAEIERNPNALLIGNR